MIGVLDLRLSRVGALLQIYESLYAFSHYLVWFYKPRMLSYVCINRLC